MKLNRNLLYFLVLLSFMVTSMSSCWYQSGKSRSPKLVEAEVYSEKKLERHRKQSVRFNKLILREEKRRQARRKK